MFWIVDEVIIVFESKSKITLFLFANVQILKHLKIIYIRVAPPYSSLLW